MAGGDIAAGKAFVEVNAKDGLAAGLRSAQSRLTKFAGFAKEVGASLVGIGAGAFAPLAAAGKVFASMGDAMAKASTRTGITVESLSTLAYAAEQSGTSFEGLETGIKKMQKAIGDAAGGSAEAQQTLAALGLTVGDLAKLSPDQQFLAIAEQISKVADPTQRAAVAMSVFGKSGTELIPLVAEGAAGIEKLRQAGRDLGLQMSGADAKAAEEFGDRMDDLWKVLKMGVFNIGAGLAPALRSLTVAITETSLRVSSWVNAHRELVASLGSVILKTAAWAAGIGAVLVVLAKVAGVVAGTIGAVLKLNAAMVFLAANPAVLGLTALAVAAGLVAIAIAKASLYTADLATALGAAMAKGDEARGVDELRAQRLAQLAKQTRLSADETKEAADLTGTLTGKYGSFGASVDKVAGKLLFAVDAQEKLNAAMRKGALADVDKSLKEAADNIAKIQGEIQARQEAAHPSAESSVEAGGVGLRAVFADKEIASLQRQREEVEKTAAALNERKKALLAGDQTAVAGAPQTETAKLQSKVAGGALPSQQDLDARKGATEAARRLMELDKQAALEGLAQIDRERAEVRALADEREGLLLKLIAGERAQPGGGRVSELARLGAAIVTNRAHEIGQLKALDDKAAADRAKADKERRDKLAEGAEYVLDLHRQAAESSGDPAGAAAIEADAWKARELARLRDMKLSDEQRDAAVRDIDTVAQHMREMSQPGQVADFFGDLRKQAAELRGDTAEVAKIEAEMFRRRAEEQIKQLGLQGQQKAEAEALIDQIAEATGKQKSAAGGARSYGTFNTAALFGIAGRPSPAPPPAPPRPAAMTDAEKEKFILTGVAPRQFGGPAGGAGNPAGGAGAQQSQSLAKLVAIGQRIASRLEKDGAMPRGGGLYYQ